MQAAIQSQTRTGPECPDTTALISTGAHSAAATCEPAQCPGKTESRQPTEAETLTDVRVSSVPLDVAAQLSEHMLACSHAPGIGILKGDQFYFNGIEAHGAALAAMARAQGFKAECRPAGRGAIGRFYLRLRKPHLVVPTLAKKVPSAQCPVPSEFQGT